MTDEDEKRLVVLLSILQLGGVGTKQEVLDNIENHAWVRLTSDEMSWMHSRPEPSWRNNFAFIRKHLVAEGSISGAFRDRWEITEAGKQEFCYLLNRASEESLFRVTPAALEAAHIVRVSMT